MKDFTLHTYKILLIALQEQGYHFQTMEEFIKKPQQKAIILRHDIDVFNASVYKMAYLEQALSISASYYFCAKHILYHPSKIKEIKQLHHEIGYHYNDLVEEKGNIGRAMDKFNKHMTTLKRIQLIATVTPHGAPLSKIDNKQLIRFIKYSNLNIIGEPYTDINFEQVLYLTDTGRRWNASKSNIRDKVIQSPLQTRFSFASTGDILAHINQLPPQIMFTIHPQRWSNHPLLWGKEYVWQGVKNRIKYGLNWLRPTL